jgi:S-formylglutathione hydrolase FrmB
MFGYAISLSGNYLASRTWTLKDLWNGDKAAKAYNSPTLYAPKVKGIRRLHFCLIVGASDFLDNTVHETQQFDAVLTKLHVPHVAYYIPGRHSWTFWRLHIVDGLEYLGQVMPA